MSNQKHWDIFRKNGESFRSGSLEEALSQDRSGLEDLWWSTRSFLMNIPNDVKFWFQRRTRGFSDDEIWGLNSAITKFIYPRIKFFATWQEEQGHSTPEEFESNPAEWLNVLNKIARAFEILAQEEYIDGLDSEKENPFPRGDSLGNEGYLPKLTVWREKNTARQAEVTEGLALFAKFYNNLWD